MLETSFSSIYSRADKVLSLEFFPPKKESLLEKTRAQIADLAACRPDYMTVTYGAGGGTRAFTQELVGFIRNKLEFPAVAHLTCVGHSAGEIDHVLDELKSVGISKVLALRGDPPAGETEFVVHPEGFANSRDLAAHIAKRGDFSIAVAGYPETHQDAKSEAEGIQFLREKVDAGAEVIMTQLFFDPEMYFRFRDMAAAVGIDIPIVPGIMPIGNVSQVKRFTNMCGASIPSQLAESLNQLENDPEGVVQFGTQHAVEMIQKLFKGGAPGVHLYTLNKSEQARPIIEAIGLNRAVAPC